MSTNASSLHFYLRDDCKNYYHVYVLYSATKVASVYPDELNYNYVFTLPSNKTSFPRDKANELKFTAFISNNDTMGNGTYYIGVKLASKR